VIEIDSSDKWVMKVVSTVRVFAERQRSDEVERVNGAEQVQDGKKNLKCRFAQWSLAWNDPGEAPVAIVPGSRFAHKGPISTSPLGFSISGLMYISHLILGGTRVIRCQVCSGHSLLETNLPKSVRLSSEPITSISASREPVICTFISVNATLRLLEVVSCCHLS
jgi:hypothetical protein